MNRSYNKAQLGILRVDSVFARIAHALWIAGGYCIVVMSLVIFYGAFSRYLFRRPIALANDLGSMLMYFCILFAMPYVQYLGQNLKLNLFDNVFPKSLLRFISNVAIPLAGLAFGAVFCWKCWDMGMSARRTGEQIKGTLTFPSYFVKTAACLFFGLLCLICVLHLLKACFGVGGESLMKPDEDKE